MANNLQDFTKQKDFLVCVDSDGCAMDTMDAKHFNCFGPCLVAEWGLEPWREAVLARWNQINLYTLTRGINRFAGLALALWEVDARYRPVAGLAELEAWVAEAPHLSEPGLELALREGGGVCLQKALAWSRAVNAAIEAMPAAGKKPFAGAAQGLAAARQVADVAIVSSANRQAILKEWAASGLLAHTDLVLAQEDGTKAHCLATLAQKGYSAQHILMVGDAPGDLAAARQNGAWFYPILVRREAASWQEFRQKALGLFTGLQYAEYARQKLGEFTACLSGKG